MKRSLLAFAAVSLSVVLAGASAAREGSPSTQAATPLDESPHAAHANGMGNLPVAVNGAENPDRIPDFVAYRHLITAMAIHDRNASPEAVERRRAHLRQAGLSESDQDALLVVLQGVRARLDLLESVRRNGSDVSPIDLDAARLQERQLLDGTRARLQAALSRRGNAQLDQYVQAEVKTRIIIYGEYPQQE